MDKSKLESYISMKNEILELRKKLEDKSDFFVNSTILDYRSGYPVPQAVVGVDTAKYSQAWHKRKKQQQELIAICAEIEEYIEDIADSETRRIFRMRYIDGMSLKDIGIIMNRDRSSIGKKIDNYIQKV